MLKPGMKVQWHGWIGILDWVIIDRIEGDNLYVTRPDGRYAEFNRASKVGPSGWIILEQPKPANIVGKVSGYGSR